VAPAAGLAHSLWHHNRHELLALVPFPDAATQVFVYAYVIAGALGAWLVVLGAVLWAAPRLAVALFRPFADRFGSQHAGGMLVTGLGIVVLCLGLFVRVMNSDADHSRVEGPAPGARVELARR